MTTIGSLFTGTGALDLAVHSALGGSMAWISDNAKHAAAIEAHHWPDVPNLGDISAIDWNDVEPVDILTGGFPCQDVSYAGRRGGMKAGNRSGLWSVMATAIETIRPSLVVIENVRGLLSANGHADLEPCPWCLGDTGPRKPALRALGAVLGSLADLGYDASWYGLTAASVGAPHRRYRVFITAWPADAHRSGLEVGGGLARDARAQRPAAGRGDPAVADAIGRVRDRWAGQSIRGPQGRAAAGWDRADVAPDPVSGELQRRGGSGRLAGAPGTDQGPGDQRQRDGHAIADRGPVAADAGRAQTAADAGGETVGLGSGSREGDSGRVGRGRPDDDGLQIDWAEYGPAIREWESRIGRPAPAPTMVGVRGGRRLSPEFVEWMMGLPAGWVTDVPGLTRNEKLKALGNGVVPQQAEAALRILLGAVAVAA